MSNKLKTFILSILVSGFLFSDAPDWQINPPSYEFSGSVSAAVYINDELVGNDNDMLAGFVDGEIRGVVTGLVFPPTGNYVFSLLLYSNQVSGETITFKFYHSESDQVFDLDETLAFESDMIVGNAFSTFNLNGYGDTDDGGGDTGDLAYYGTPEWDVDGDGVLDGYAAYENNGSVTGIVLVDDVSYGTIGDMIAGFVDGEQRGVGVASEIPPFFGGGYAFQMMLYSNVTSGELVTFQFYDASVDAVYNLSETLEFETNMIIGDIVDPFNLTFNPGEDIPDPVLGCTDQLACNYDETATSDDGTCEYAEEFYDCNGNCLSDSDGDDVCDELEIFGCTNPDGLNYNEDATEDDGSCILTGCTDELACNFDSNASADDGSCEYAEENYDCDGNCTIEIDCEGVCGGDAYEDECGTCDSLPFNDCVQDCNGEWGGNALEDECGICDGPGAVYECGCADIEEDYCDCNGNVLDDCGDCGGDNGAQDICGVCDGDNSSCSGCTDSDALNYDESAILDDGSCIFDGDLPPELFEYSQSSQQAFYFFDFVGINNIEISSDDWVGAFNGDVCVGSRKWDLSLCNDNICDLPVMGDDGEEYSSGYMQDGQIPTFKIYDYSEGIFYDAISSENLEWQNNGMYYIDSLNVLEDCLGVVGGDAVEDECGVCDGLGAIYECGCADIEEGYCDCDGNILDDCGDCGGDNQAQDECGVCNGNNEDQDECGICFGNGYFDQCGTCDEDPENDCVQDCAGNWGGNALVDECGVCDGPGSIYECGCTDIEEGYCDCDGNILDECGICSGSGYEDQCGICDEDPSNDCVQDCNGEWGGNALEDECGICDGPGAVYECGCVDIEEDYCDCDGNVLDDCGDCGGDNGAQDICGVCDGDNSSCSGCTDSDALNYDESAILDDGSCFYTLVQELDLHEGANLVSFYALPEDPDIQSFTSSIQNSIFGVIGEGIAAAYFADSWIGSLISINEYDGYWFIMENQDVLSVEGYPTDLDLEYNLHAGANLISFPSENSYAIEDVIPEILQGTIYGILGEGQGAVYNNGEWEGSLENLSGGSGYWFKTYNDVVLTFELDNLLSRNFENKQKQILLGYEYNQSSQQSFYFIEQIQGIEYGDWILAFNEDIVVGARQWIDETVDIAVMGSDGFSYSDGYCLIDDIPTFKLYKSQTNELVDLYGQIDSWSPNNIQRISSLVFEESLYPEQVSIKNVYPNPFNPTTKLEFNVPNKMNIEINLLDINGRLVKSITNSEYDKGSYQIEINGSDLSSGVYFVELSGNNQIDFSKIILLK